MAWRATKSIGTLGPIVEARKADFRKEPLTAAGFDRMIESVSTARFSANRSVEKLALPIGLWIIAVRSVRNSTLPALAS
jgi:hypothetical protein